MQGQRKREEESSLQFNGNTRESFAFVRQYCVELQTKGLEWTIDKDSVREPRLPNLPAFRTPNKRYEESLRDGTLPFALTPQKLPEKFFRPMNSFSGHVTAPRDLQDPASLDQRWNESEARHSPPQSTRWDSADARTAIPTPRVHVPYDGRYGNWPYYTPMDFRRLTPLQVEEEKFFMGQMQKYQEQLEKFEKLTNTALGIFRKALSPAVISKLKKQLENTTVTPEKRLQAALTQFKILYCTASIKFQNCALIDCDIDKIAPATRYDQVENVIQQLENLFEERALMDLEFDDFSKNQKLFSRLQGPDFMSFVVTQTSKSGASFTEVCAELRSVCARVQATQQSTYGANAAREVESAKEIELEKKKLQEENEMLKRRLAHRDTRNWQGGGSRYDERHDNRGRERYQDRDDRDGQRRNPRHSHEPDSRSQRFARDQKRARTDSRKQDYDRPRARAQKATTCDGQYSDDDDDYDPQGNSYDSDMEEY